MDITFLDLISYQQLPMV